MSKIQEKYRNFLSIFIPILPYGVLETWEDLNPRLYQAIHIYWLKFYGLWYNNYSPRNILFWIHSLYAIVVLWLVCFLPEIGEVYYLLKRKDDIEKVVEV